MGHAISFSTVHSSSNSRRVCHPNTPIQSSTGLHKIITPDNYSSLECSVAVKAYVQHFIDNLKQSRDVRMIGPLTATELNTARLKQVFTSEISMLIHNAPLSDITRFPYLLPQKHDFTKLLIYSLHISLPWRHQQHSHSSETAVLGPFRLTVHQRTPSSLHHL